MRPVRANGKPGLDPEIAAPILKEVRERLRFLNDVGLEYLTLGRSAESLSGGEAARAGLAVALANQPVLILADEPTGELDEVTAQRIMDLLRKHADSGAAVLIVTHNADVAAAADREVALHDGQVV